MSGTQRGRGGRHDSLAARAYNMTIIANVSAMFASIDPSNVSGSVSELGPRAAELTWGNALKIAKNSPAWLVTGESETADEMASWARGTGAWDAEEIEAMTYTELLALFVQNVASDLRVIGSDENEVESCTTASNPDVADELTGYYFTDSDGSLTVEYYAAG